MPSGSKPGERRGGRRRGTQNKTTLLKNAAINAAAAKPNLSPLEFLLTLMRQRDLPLELRVSAAQQALPFAHYRPKAQIRVNRGYKQSLSDVNEKIGPRVKVARVNADDPNDVEAYVMPLDFLLDHANHHRVAAEWQGQMRHYYEINWADRRIWGATAAMIVNLGLRLQWSK